MDVENLETGSHHELFNNGNGKKKQQTFDFSDEKSLSGNEQPYPSGEHLSYNYGKGTKHGGGSKYSARRDVDADDDKESLASEGSDKIENERLNS